MAERRRPTPSKALPDEHAARLAELVTELTGTEPGAALHAVRHGTADDRADALEVVASAMVNVDQPVPKGFRVAPFVKDDDTAAP